MKHIELRELANGRWLYAVFVAGRVTVIGECATRERALEAARLV
jgi:hypothetical protein